VTTLKKRRPWTTVSAADIQARIDLRIGENLSIKSVLLDVFDTEKLREQAREILNESDPLEILRPFMAEEPRWVVRCSVKDSRVSGVWGLKSFTMGKRGYLYHVPDYGSDSPYEDLPILSAWEPIEDVEAFRCCFLDIYTKGWDDFDLPPYMGQWARGPFPLMLDAICAILRKRCSAWSGILDALYEGYGQTEERKGRFRGVVNETARRTTTPALVVSEILRSPWQNRATIITSPSLTEQESRVLVAAFLFLIGGSGF
jgi:hypothetical protein